MQIFEVSMNDTFKLLTREPFLIVRLSINTQVSQLTSHVTGEIEKPYQDHMFTLRVIYLIWMTTIIELDHLSWPHLLGKDSQISSPYSTMEEPLLGTSSHIHYHQNGRQASSVWSLGDAPLELTHSYLFFFLHNDDLLKINMNAHSILFFKTCLQ